MNGQLSVKHGFSQPGNHIIINYIDKTIFQNKYMGDKIVIKY